MAELAVTALVALAAGVGVGWLLERLVRGAAFQRRDEILAQAQRDADNVRKSQELSGKEELLARREELEKDMNRVREELREQERRLDRRETSLDDQQQDIVKKERMLELTQRKLAERSDAVEARDVELQQVLKQQQDQLYKISGMSAQTAQDTLLSRLNQELKNETGAVILKHEQELKANCDKMAREIIGMAVQRYAASHTSETTVSSVDIPSDEMKGRIIGREGRNIRAFETATGVDVIIDDTPDTVIISCFDPIRREIARRALAALIVDGRIHPGRIEELVVKAKKELEGEIQELGEQAAYDTGIAGLHGEMIRLIGRMKYRTSYGQNILEHSKEVAWLAGMMAAELKLDVMLAKRGALLHDVGKVLTYEHEGTHVELGVEMAKKYGESAAVINCIQAHHDDVPHESTESVLVQAADAISGSRPGARREAFESYVKRLTNLEEIATSYPGVEKANAIQAGREIRVVVTPDKIDDAQAALLSETIARRIEGELQYPGQIRVVVIRETRAVGLAK
jgi:ribonuclease Y